MKGENSKDDGNFGKCFECLVSDHCIPSSSRPVCKNK